MRLARDFTLPAMLAALCIALVGLTLPQDKAGEASPQPKPQDAKADWPAPYSPLHEGALSNVKALLDALPFDRIELERTACFGACPAYKVTFNRDGTARYEGRSDAPRQGNFAGKIEPWNYGRLCYLMEVEGLERMNHDYTAPWTDAPTCYLRVWRSGATEPFTIDDYGTYGPIELWGLQQAIDGVAEKLEWKPVPKSR